MIKFVLLLPKDAWAPLHYLTRHQCHETTIIKLICSLPQTAAGRQRASYFSRFNLSIGLCPFFTLRCCGIRNDLIYYTLKS